VMSLCTEQVREGWKLNSGWGYREWRYVEVLPLSLVAVYGSSLGGCNWCTPKDLQSLCFHPKD
jgi:hypothetical protein